MMRQSIWLLPFLLFFSACDITPEAGVDQKTFFDIKGYFDGEVQRLASKGRARKIVVADGKQEEKIVDCIDLKKELAVFADADINRPAWSDKYVADTTFGEQNELLQVQIKAVDKMMKTQRIEIDYSNSAVSKITIENNSSSSMATSRQSLVYEPKVGYTIESHQKVTMTNDQVFQVVVRFLN